MREKAVERAWHRLETKIRNTIVNKLYYSFSIYSMSYDETMAEMMFVFFNNFYEIYENDNQYMRYIFIVFKRKMIDIYSRESKFYKMHKMIGGNENNDDNSVYEQNDKLDVLGYNNKNKSENILEQLAHKEVIGMIRKRLNENEVKIFDMMLIGMREYEIAEKLNISKSAIGAIKRKKIWPNTCYVLNIPETKYEYLTSSGRIFCS